MPQRVHTTLCRCDKLELTRWCLCSVHAGIRMSLDEMVCSREGCRHSIEEGTVDVRLRLLRQIFSARTALFSACTALTWSWNFQDSIIRKSCRINLTSKRQKMVYCTLYNWTKIVWLPEYSSKMWQTPFFGMYFCDDNTDSLAMSNWFPPLADLLIHCNIAVRASFLGPMWLSGGFYHKEKERLTHSSKAR